MAAQISKKRKVTVSGKLGAQRAKSMKFKDGYMISSGYPVCWVSKLKSCLIGILRASRAMTPLPDLVTLHPPKDEKEFKEKKESEAVVPPTNIEVPVLV
ncbi:hypothetical protein J1N35_003174 [Gossypium stocksii]|uniref:Uncharacterized protein n=1 Tax=Gossypium stocksii TaxID=47602 RepID=A0A9D3WPE0_9ROSI|nr:hypothetical protein J1N35_003174 [Gossypium stocksii]